MIRVHHTSNLYEGPLATELLPSLIKETNRMCLGRDLSNQSFLHLFSPPSFAIFSGWPRKQRGSCRSACAPSPRWVRARTRLELLVLPTASLLLFLSNCTCSDSGIAAGSAPRLAAAAPAHGSRVWKLLPQPLCYAREIRKPLHKRQMLQWSQCSPECPAAPRYCATGSATQYQPWLSSSPTTLRCYTSGKWQKCTIIHDPVCLLKIIPPFNLASGLPGSISVKLQGNDHLPRLWPHWIFRGWKLNSYHEGAYWRTDA